MSNDKSDCNRRDFLALGALAAAAVGKNASASPLFNALLVDNSLPVGFCELDGERVRNADYVYGKNISPSVNVSVDGNVDNVSYEDIELSVEYPKASPFRAWSYGGYPLANTSAPTSFLVPQKSTKGLKLAVKVRKDGKTKTHRISLCERASEKGLRPGHYALLLEESNPNWRKLNLQNLPAHILLTVESA